MKQSALPRVLRAASFRLAAIYVGVFVVSASVLGMAVFLEARSVLQQQMRERVETETAFLREAFQHGGLAQLAALVRTRE